MATFDQIKTLLETLPKMQAEHTANKEKIAALEARITEQKRENESLASSLAISQEKDFKLAKELAAVRANESKLVQQVEALEAFIIKMRSFFNENQPTALTQMPVRVASTEALPKLAAAPAATTKWWDNSDDAKQVSFAALAATAGSGDFTVVPPRHSPKREYYYVCVEFIVTGKCTNKDATDETRCKYSHFKDEQPFIQKKNWCPYGKKCTHYEREQRLCGYGHTFGEQVFQINSLYQNLDKGEEITRSSDSEMTFVKP